MAKKISTKQLLEEYKQFYPDVTTTTCSVSSEKDSFSAKTAFDLALKIGGSQGRYLLFWCGSSDFRRERRVRRRW